MPVNKVNIFLLSWLTVVAPSSGQVTLISCLETGLKFACPGDRVSYICSGPGPLMSLYAPPLLSRNSRALFVDTDNPGQTGLQDGPFTATLLSTTPLTGQLTLDTRNISLTNLEVICENGPLDSSVINMAQNDVNAANGVNSITKGSAFSIDGDMYGGTMNASWEVPSGNFDIDCYEVSVFKNNVQIMMFNTTSTSMETTYSGTVGDIVFVRIVVISRCGVWSGPFETNRVSPKLSGSVVAVIVFMLIFLILFVAALVAVVVVLVSGTKN